MARTGRNSVCPCGSGKKYKRCCLNQAEREAPSLSLANVSDAIALGLNHQGLNVTGVRLVNDDTFLVEFATEHSASVDIKSEIATAIGFLNGFFRDNELSPISPRSYAAQAITHEGRPLIHAISSRSAAEHLSNGRSIEWLHGTVFQEHTQEFRLGLAKRRIAELENGLRSLIRRVLSDAVGTDWWMHCVGNKVRQQTELMYERQEGIECSDGDTLIDFTFLLDLRKIVVSNWDSFRQIFPDQTRFAECLELLNKIRRREAHNRELSEQDVHDLDEIHGELMSAIAQVVPDAAANFLQENWRNRLAEIFASAAESGDICERSSSLDTGLLAMRRQISRFQDIEARVTSVTPPPAMLSIHAELLTHLDGVHTTMEAMIEFETIRDAARLSDAQTRFEVANRELLAFREKYLMTVL